MLKYREKVKITEGFYEGQEGIIIKDGSFILGFGDKERQLYLYDVQLNDGLVIKNIDLNSLLKL